jgi:glycosyltransferase involved in cell wall biosynthesis
MTKKMITILNIEATGLPTMEHIDPLQDYLLVLWRADTVVGTVYAQGADIISGSVPGELPPGRSTTPSLPGLTAPRGEERVSVVICTRDRPQELAQCLQSLTAQEQTAEQILVVDNASKSDETRRVATEAGVDYVREDRPGLDIARNTGARNSRGDIILYTDDDVMLHRSWISRMAAAFDAPEIWAVTGLILPAELASEAQIHFERYWGFGRGFERRDLGPDYYAATRRQGCPAWKVGAGASMGFRRDVFNRIGYFDERLDAGAAGCSGDSEFWNRILHHGGTCRYEPSAIAFHFHRKDMAGLSRQIQAYMSGHTAALLVQFGNTREFGNLRRLFLSLPKYYLARVLRMLIRGKSDDSRFLREEIIGCCQGVTFMVQHKLRRGLSQKQG